MKSKRFYQELLASSYPELAQIHLSFLNPHHYYHRFQVPCPDNLPSGSADDYELCLSMN